MKMNEKLKAVLLTAFFCGMGGVKAAPLPNVPDSVYVFAYNTGANEGRNGLHFAWSANRKQWKEIGPEHAFVKSDYAAWGAGKRMYNPYLLLLSDGTWCCVWQVNNNVNQFAVTTTPDLINWYPQDYPYMEGVSSCLSPVVSYDKATGTYTVVFQTKEGDYYATASKDFYRFTKPVKTDRGAYASRTEKVDVAGRSQQGQIYKVPYSSVEKLVRTQENALYWGAMNGELARDNDTRFAGLKPLEATITVDAGQRKAISDKLIGIFFEDINYAADGGLYAELVQNRDFEYDPSDTRGANKDWNAKYGWTLEGEGDFSIATADPIHPNNPHYAVLKTTGAAKTALKNSGFDGIVVRKGEKYDVSLFARQLDGKAGKIRIRLLQDGNVIGETTVGAPGKVWKKQTAVIRATGDADAAVLSIEPQVAGTLALDMVSLFPQKTFKGRKNGMRADLAQTLADMKPKFMRFPGGCVAHGDGLHNMYRWKETIGPLESRKPQRNIWGYHQTKGLGYYEYFQLCEDLGCEPLPVLPAGVCCQNSADGGAGQQGGIPMEQMDEYVQEVLDLIEWANGDAKTTEWGRRRAEQGHPKPFNLKYIGIGNEDLISKTFGERYLMIIKAVKEKYPDITVCGTVGPWSEGSDYETGWRLAKDNHIDMVDEHYYQTPGWFIYHQDYYDHYDRSASKVYLGEYAAHVPGRHNNIESALSEALHICGLERNGDVVAMSSYAPLLAKDNHTQWRPDMIYFNNKEVKPTVGYFVQKMCGNSAGDEYLESSLSVNERRKGVRERLAVSTVRDSKTGKTYLKMVNLLNHPVKGHLVLKGMEDALGEKGEKHARMYVLSGAHDDRNARPVEKSITVSSAFDYELPVYSFSLIEL